MDLLFLGSAFDGQWDQVPFHGALPLICHEVHLRYRLSRDCHTGMLASILLFERFFFVTNGVALMGQCRAEPSSVFCPRRTSPVRRAFLHYKYVFGWPSGGCHVYQYSI